MKKFIMMLTCLLLAIFTTSCSKSAVQPVDQFDADSLSAQVTNAVNQQINPSFNNMKDFRIYRDSLIKLNQDKQVFINISQNAFEQCARVTLSKYKSITFTLFMKEYKEGYDHVYKYLQAEQKEPTITIQTDPDSLSPKPKILK